MEISKTPSGIVPVAPVALTHNDEQSSQNQNTKAQLQVESTQTAFAAALMQEEFHTTEATVWAVQNLAVYLSVLASQKEQEQKDSTLVDNQDPQ